MMYTLSNGKNVRVPDDVIAKYEKSFNFTKDEAVQMFLEEEGYVVNAEMAELDEKASKVKIKHGAVSAEMIANSRKKTQKERVKKIDESKNALFAMILAAIPSDAANINVTTDGKKVEFEWNGESYSIDLVKHRKQK